MAQRPTRVHQQCLGCRPRARLHRVCRGGQHGLRRRGGKGDIFISTPHSLSRSLSICISLCMSVFPSTFLSFFVSPFLSRTLTCTKTPAPFPSVPPPLQSRSSSRSPSRSVLAALCRPRPSSTPPTSASTVATSTPTPTSPLRSNPGATPAPSALHPRGASPSTTPRPGTGKKRERKCLLSLSRRFPFSPSPCLSFSPSVSLLLSRSVSLRLFTTQPPTDPPYPLPHPTIQPSPFPSHLNPPGWRPEVRRTGHRVDRCGGSGGDRCALLRRVQRVRGAWGGAGVLGPPSGGRRGR